MLPLIQKRPALPRPFGLDTPGPRILLSTSHESLPDGPERPGRQPIFGLEISGKCLNMDGVYNGKSYERPYEDVMKKNEHGMI